MDAQTPLGGQGLALLESLPPYCADAAWTLGERLRREGHPAEVVAQVLTQSRLRARAESVLGLRARRMLFTQAGLEQATRAVVADLRATRLTAVAGRVADLCCGLGSDAIAFAEAGLDVLAVDRDPWTAALAAHNLRPWPTAQVRCADVREVPLDGVDVAYIDPARRTAQGRRLLDPRQAEPPLSFVLDLADRLPGVVAKVAPGIDHALVPPRAHARWVSVDGDVVEAGLWFGTVAPAGRVGATVITAGAVTEIDDTDPRAAERPPVGGLDEYLFEPDGAVIRAGLVGAVAAAVGGHLIDDTIAYVTSDRASCPATARGYRVLDSFGFGLKPLRAYLRARDVGVLTIKKRGTAVQPEALRRQLRLQGSQTAMIVLTRLAGRQSVIVVEPCDPAGD